MDTSNNGDFDPNSSPLDFFEEFSNRMSIHVNSRNLIVKFHKLTFKYYEGHLSIIDYFRDNHQWMFTLKHLFLAFMLFDLADWDVISEWTSPNKDLNLVVQLHLQNESILLGRNLVSDLVYEVNSSNLALSQIRGL
jgi:hypothetical protein